MPEKSDLRLMPNKTKWDVHMFMKSNVNAPVVKLEFDAQLTPAGPKGAWCHLHFPGDFEKTLWLARSGSGRRHNQRLPLS